MLGVGLGSFRGVVCRVMKMPLSGVRVVRGRLVIVGFVMPCGFAMMTRGVFVVIGCFGVMLCCLLGHRSSLRFDCGCIGYSAPGGVTRR
jgi:hypothetical protein